MWRWGGIERIERERAGNPGIRADGSVRAGEPTTTLALEPATTVPLDPANFSDPTRIDNPYFPMVPGTHWSWRARPTAGAGCWPIACSSRSPTSRR